MFTFFKSLFKRDDKSKKPAPLPVKPQIKAAVAKPAAKSPAKPGPQPNAPKTAGVQNVAAPSRNGGAIAANELEPRLPVAPSANAEKSLIIVEDSPKLLNSMDDLAKMQPGFKRMLKDQFDLARLIGKMCPIELDDGTVAIFCLPGQEHSDQIEELEKMILKKRLKLASPARRTIASQFLLPIVREQLTAELLKNRRKILADPEKSAMASAFKDMVTWGVRFGASDVHLNANLMADESEVKFTIGGKYILPDAYKKIATSTLMEILSVAWMDIHGGNGAVFDPVIEQQGRMYLEVDKRPIMLRWASLATDIGPSVTLRILILDAQTQSGSFSDLGYLPSQVAQIDRARTAEGGAIVLAGTVGSGKSTTIACVMSMIPRTRKVITLEDPVEYIIPNAQQNTIARPLDNKTSGSFDAKLKTIKRSAMNDLLIGEIRDEETGRAFMDLAGSGTNLYTTTHTGSAILIPDRLCSDFIGVSRDFCATPGVMKLLVFQALLPKLCSCSLPLSSMFDHGGIAYDGSHKHGEYWRRYSDRIERLYQIDAVQLRVRNEIGCPICKKEHLPELNGFMDRTVVAEMAEPGTDDEFLQYVRRSDNLALRDHFISNRKAEFDKPDMDGKTAMECAIYKASQGEIDPREIEPRFKAFETVEIERTRRAERESRGRRISAVA